MAVDIKKSAEDTSFEDSEIHGDVSVAGKKTQFINTKIFEYGKKHPLLTISGGIAFTAAIITIFKFIAG